MSSTAAFTIYPDPADSSRKTFVLLHGESSRWFITNRTGLEICTMLVAGRSDAAVAEYLSEQYQIPLERAERDVETASGALRLFSEVQAVEMQPKLLSLTLHITNRCNLTCSHCYLSCDPSADDLPLEVNLGAVREFAEGGGELLTVSGGEPLCHPGVEEILREACGKIRRVKLLTNGTTVSPALAARLAHPNLEVQISIEGAEAASHDQIRGAGAFERAVLGIKAWSGVLGPEKITLCATITRTNIDNLLDLVRLARDLRVNTLRFLPVRPVGRAKDLCEQPSGDEYRECFSQLAAIHRSVAGSLKLSYGVSGFMLHIPPDCINDTWCPVGRRIIVEADGECYPCETLIAPEFSLGNIREARLADMMQTRAMNDCRRALAERRKAIPKCSCCSWRNLCQAGCMGKARDESGTIWAPDAFCDYRFSAYTEAFDSLLAGRSKNPQ